MINILFVDDDKDILESLKRSFRKDYNIFTESNAKKALEFLKEKNDIGIIVSDFSMPEMNGVEFLAKSKEVSPNSIRIMLTGLANINDIVEAINEGSVNKFLFKPIQNDLLKSHIDYASRLYNVAMIENESAKLRSSFTSIVSKQYKDPLAAILTSTYLLNEYFKQNNDHSFSITIERIQNTIFEMVSTLDSVISINNIDNLLKLNVSEFHIKEEIQEVIDEIKYMDANKHQIVLTCDENITKVSTDLALLSVAFRSVLINSIAFSKENSHINVDILNNGINTVLTVTDFGSGISKNDIKSIFEPFYSQTYSKDIKNNGLGLAIALKALNKISGQIAIESELGIGTKTSLYFPHIKDLENE